MKLTGKSKEMFEEWLVCGNGKINFEKYYSDCDGNNDPYGWFCSLSDAKKYGVLVDFFDSVGVCIFITDDYDYETNKTIETFIPLIRGYKGNTWESYKTRSQAREIAIEKAVEINNNRL